MMLRSSTRDSYVAKRQSHVVASPSYPQTSSHVHAWSLTGPIRVSNLARPRYEQYHRDHLASYILVVKADLVSKHHALPSCKAATNCDLGKADLVVEQGLLLVQIMFAECSKIEKPPGDESIMFAECSKVENHPVTKFILAKPVGQTW